MKTTIIGLLLLATASVNAQEKAQTYQLADAPRYSEETGYGLSLIHIYGGNPKFDDDS